MRNIERTLILMIALLSASSAMAQARFKIVVNNGVQIDALSKRAVSDLFLKKTAKWNNGLPVVPVDQVQSTLRDDFSRDIHGKATTAVKSYWNQQIFSGREIPPVEKSSDQDVLAFVRSTAGAVGYVSEETRTDGVRTIRVD